MTRTYFSRPTGTSRALPSTDAASTGIGRQAVRSGSDSERPPRGPSQLELPGETSSIDFDELEGQLTIDLRVEPPVLLLGGTDVAPLSAEPPSLRSRIGVRAVDLAIALPAFMIAAPIVALLMIAVRLTSRGPAIFASRRITRDGREFKMWKLRTMVLDGDGVLAAHFREHPEDELLFHQHMKLEHDPRVTPLGRFLRKWSLDELPQLWNVIRGHMSIVGPRPLLHEEAARLGRVYPTVVRVKGGLTGLWQVSGRSTLSFAQRIPLDVEYVTNRTLRGDLKILMRTVGQLLRGRPGAF